MTRDFDLQFVDFEFGGLLDSIPVTVTETNVIESSWNREEHGFWNNSLIWTPTVFPNANHQVAMFGDAILEPFSVVADSDTTVKGMRVVVTEPMSTGWVVSDTVSCDASLSR